MFAKIARFFSRKTTTPTANEPVTVRTWDGGEFTFVPEGRLGDTPPKDPYANGFDMQAAVRRASAY